MATHRIGSKPARPRNTTLLPGRREPADSTISIFSQGGIKLRKAPGLSWKENTVAGAALIRDSLTY
jgi:hypothetical protein